MRGAAPAPDPDLSAQREVVEAFLAAAREGDFERLLEVLDPDVVLKAEFGPGQFREVHGAEAVIGQARSFAQIGLTGHLALVNGAIGTVTLRGGEPFSVGGVTVRGGRIVEIDFLADPERLARLDLSWLSE